MPIVRRTKTVRYQKVRTRPFLCASQKFIPIRTALLPIYELLYHPLQIGRPDGGQKLRQRGWSETFAVSYYTAAPCRCRPVLKKPLCSLSLPILPEGAACFR